MYLKEPKLWPSRALSIYRFVESLTLSQSKHWYVVLLHDGGVEDHLPSGTAHCQCSSGTGLPPSCCIFSVAASPHSLFLTLILGLHHYGEQCSSLFSPLVPHLSEGILTQSRWPINTFHQTKFFPWEIARPPSNLCHPAVSKIDLFKSIKSKIK